MNHFKIFFLKRLGRIFHLNLKENHKSHLIKYGSTLPVTFMYSNYIFMLTILDFVVYYISCKI